jgi:type I restriction enzyme, S subunit
MKWKNVKLKDISNNLDSKRKPLNDQERSKISHQKLYPYIGANNVMGYVDEFLFDEDILCVAEDGGSWGKNQKCATIYRGKTWVNNHAHVLTAKEGTDLRFLMYYLNQEDLNRYITGTTRGKLTKSALETIEVPLPPLHIQQQIADTLDKADALRRKDQELLQKYDELAQSIFYDMFGDPVRNERGWRERTIAEMVTFMTSGSRGWAQYYSDKGDLFLRINNVGRNKLLLDDLIFVSTPDSAEARRTRVQPGDILLSITADLGRTAVIPKTFPTAYINQHLALLRLEDSVDPVYVSQFLSSPGGQKQIQSANKGGVKAGLNFDDIRSLRILVPPTELQRQFSQNLSRVYNLTIKGRENVTVSQELFNGLIHQYFS